MFSRTSAFSAAVLILSNGRFLFLTGRPGRLVGTLDGGFRSPRRSEQRETNPCDIPLY